jgi:hypothetical protein
MDGLARVEECLMMSANGRHGYWQFYQVATLSMLPVVGLPKPA